MTEAATTLEQPSAGAGQSSKPTNATATQPSNSSSSRTDAKGRKPRSVTSYSRPRFKQKLVVHSLQAQRVIERSLSRVSYSLFSLDVILQIIGERDEVDQVEQVIHADIDKAGEDLDARIDQLEALMKQHNIQDIPSYSHPYEQVIEISSPQIRLFADLISKLDKLMALVDTLWLHGVLKSKQRTHVAQEWQQHLNKLAAKIIGVEKRARVSAHTKGKQEEVDQAAPESSDHGDFDEEANADEADVTNEPSDKAEKPAKVAEPAAAS